MIDPNESMLGRGATAALRTSKRCKHDAVICGYCKNYAAPEPPAEPDAGK